jgi:hypothetical protein
VNYINDRKQLGYKAVKDTNCDIKLVRITEATVLLIRNLPSKVNHKTKRVILVIAIASRVYFSSVEGIDLPMSPTPVVRVEPSYQTPEALKSALEIRCGDLGKSGPGPRAKADAARNARKTGGRSGFTHGFTPQRQYCSYHNNNPLSCRNHAKLKNNPFDNNQDPRVRNNAANTNSQNLSVKKDEVAKPSESVTKPYSEIRHELETKQHQKTIKIDVAGKTYMIENTDRMGVDQLENKLAEQMYNSIRDNDKDISDIAVYTKIKADNIKKCKDHIFYNEHVLDRYVHLGEDPVVQCFDPDLKLALAWKRFEIGEHTPEDMEWLKHEYAERYIESTYDAGYTESHDRAQSRFDGNPWKDD